ncbi:MAG: hypothetical protein GSR77_05495 [Desulfurococcales archaeon]|nr:hypothetical protein [Desulfurococcales archaeon]
MGVRSYRTPDTRRINQECIYVKKIWRWGVLSLVIIIISIILGIFVYNRTGRTLYIATSILWLIILFINTAIISTTRCGPQVIDE